MKSDSDPRLASIARTRFGSSAGGFFARPESARAAWSCLSGWDEGAVDWLDGPASTVWRQIPPVPGERAEVLLRDPFQGRIGEPFWCHVPGATAHYNGYGEGPADFEDLRLVRAVTLALAGSGEVESGHWTRRATVTVTEVLGLNDLLARPPGVGQLGFVSDLERPWRHHAGQGAFHCVSAFREAIAGVWAIWHEQGDGAHLLVAGECAPGLARFDAGNRLLVPEELVILKGKV